MTGYQEIFTDPSYFGQIMVTASTHIGNYGTKGSEDESAQLQIAGLVCRQFSQIHSRPSASEGLLERFAREAKVAIDGIDTRAVVRHIRDKGAMNALITTEISDPEALRERISDVPRMEGLELSSVSDTTYEIGSANAPIRVAALDYGVKRSLTTRRAQLSDRYSHAHASGGAAELRSTGIFLSNGPGDPAAMTQNIDQVRAIVDSTFRYLVFALGISCSACLKDCKQKRCTTGIRINHPVLNLESGLGEITAKTTALWAPSSLEGRDDIVLTQTPERPHRSGNPDQGKTRLLGTVPSRGVSGYDSRYLFDAFCGYMKNENKK